MSHTSAEAGPAELDALPWIEVAPGAREKRARRGPVRLRLLELTPRFVEEGWCVRGHAGIVLEGELEIALRSGTFRARAGEGIVLPGGEAGAHRARSLAGRTLLFLVEEG